MQWGDGDGDDGSGVNAPSLWRGRYAGRIAHELRLAATLDGLAHALLDENHPIDEQFDAIREASCIYAAALARGAGGAGGGAAVDPAADDAGGTAGTPLAAFPVQWPPAEPPSEEPLDFMLHFMLHKQEDRLAPPRWAAVHTAEALRALKEAGDAGDPDAAARCGCSNSGMALQWLAELAMTATNRGILSTYLAELNRLPPAEQHVENGAALFEAGVNSAPHLPTEYP